VQLFYHKAAGTTTTIATFDFHDAFRSLRYPKTQGNSVGKPLENHAKKALKNQLLTLFDYA